MKSEIISVGSEILIGDIIDTNSEYISKRLAELGINCYFHTSVGDNEIRLSKTIETALERSDVVFLSGGLGPTYDDKTKEITARVLGLELVYDEDTFKRIEAIFSKSNRKLTDNNKKQAYVPKGSKILTNYNGTAPGILIEHDEKVVVLLPGPPHEMKEMFEHWVIPYFSEKTGKTIVSHRIYLFDIGESYVEEILNEEMVHYENPTIAPYSGSDGIYLRITASADSKDKAEKLIEPVLQHVLNTFKEYVYSIDIPSLEETLVHKLKEKKLKLASAESCTGGYLGKRLTDIPGSSEVFELGLVTYSNRIKHLTLGVQEETLENHGAVSKETVVEMSNNLLELSSADVAVAISGIAGPGGGTKEKPVGTVYISVQTHQKMITRKLMLSRNYQSDRKRIRSLSVSHAFKMILDLIDSI